jgi:lysophospholipase L1-like esterase
METVFNKSAIFFLVFFLTNKPNGFSQNVPYDSSFRTERFYVEWEQFRHFPQSRKDIIFLGNSITFYINWTEFLNDLNVKNRGISGDHTFGILERLGDIVKGKPAKVFILIGINDLARNYPDTVILRNYKRMINAFKLGSPETKLYFQSILPVNIAYPKAKGVYNKSDHILAINSALKELCNKEDVTFVDLHSRFIDDSGQLKKEYTYDGVHINLAGYIQWVNVIKQYLKKR